MAITPKEVGIERGVQDYEKTIDSILRCLPQNRPAYDVYSRFNPTEKWVLEKLKSNYLNAGWISFEEIEVGNEQGNLYYYHMIAPTGE